MGQQIEIASTRVVDDVAVFTTDRSLTGTDGEGFDSLDEAQSSSGFAAKLAIDLFEADPAIVRVYVASNVVIITRSGGWDDVVLDEAQSVISDFFLYYPASA